MDRAKKNGSENTGQCSYTQTNKRRGGHDSDNSLSSLGSLADIASVTRNFSDDFSHLLVDRNSSATSAIPVTSVRKDEGSSSESRAEMKDSELKEPRKSDSDLNYANRTCPHCRRVFVNSWAVPKHVIVSKNTVSFKIDELGKEDLLCNTSYHPRSSPFRFLLNRQRSNMSVEGS